MGTGLGGRLAGAMLPAVLWRNRGVRRLVLADLTSSLGSGISTIAYPLLVLSLGGSAIQAGSVVTIALVTRLLLRLPAGALVDRWKPRTVMINSDLTRAFVVGSVPLAAMAGRLSFAQLAVVAVVEGLASALFGPALSVLTRDLTSNEQEDLTETIGLDQSVQAGTGLIGPAVGGVLFVLGTTLPFTIDAASYLVSAFLIWRIASQPQAKDETAGTSPKGLLAGARWVIRESGLLSVLLYACGINLIAAALDVLVVVVLRSHGEPGSMVGLVLSCAGLGAVIGSLLAPKFVLRLHAPTILLGIGVGWTVVLGTFAFHYSAWLVAALLPVLMMLSPAAGVVVGRALLSQAPRALLGRISAATSITLSGLAALGPVAAGSLFEWLHTSGSWTFMACATALLTLLSWSPLRRATALDAPVTSQPASEPQPVAEAHPEIDRLEPEVLAHQLQPEPGRMPPA